MHRNQIFILFLHIKFLNWQQKYKYHNIYNHLNLSTMEKLIAAIKAQVNAILADIDKVDNKAAKARVRKATLLLEKAAKEYRKVSVK